MINHQVSKYKGAVGKRNIGSDASPRAMTKASNTAIGRNRSSSVTTGSIASKSPRGSWEGYMHGPSTNLQMNNTGYLAKAAQKARNNPRQSMNFSSPTPKNIDAKYQVRAKPFDYTYCGSPGNSSHLLKEHMQLNDLFKG